MTHLPAGPSTLFIEVTSTCNLRCRQCHLWMSEEPSDALSTDDKLRLVREYAALREDGTVVLTGGEPMAKTEEFFALTSVCAELGLSSAANTNGTCWTQATPPRLARQGPKYLVVSIDSHDADVHDRLRGVPGTWEQATGLVRTLRAELNGHRDPYRRVLTNTILFDRNLAELADTVRFILELGVDGVMFQALSRTFGLRSTRDVAFERHFPNDTALFDAAIGELLKMKRGGLPILTTEADLEWMKLYVRDPEFIGEQVCGSGVRNLMVDQHGEAQLCFSMRSLTAGRSLGNVRGSSLASLWAGDAAVVARDLMASCRRSCGMLNCHRKPTRGES